MYVDTTYRDVVPPLDVDEQTCNVASQDLEHDVSVVESRQSDRPYAYSAKDMSRTADRDTTPHPRNIPRASIWTHNSPESLERRKALRQHVRECDGRVEVATRCRPTDLART